MRVAALTLLLVSAAAAQPAGSTLVSAGGPGGDTGEAIAGDLFTGETVVVGTFEQTAAFGPGVTVTSADAPAARSDAFLVLYGADGAARWARRMGTNVFNDFGAGVALRSPFAGGDVVYASGYFTGVATFDGGANPSVSLTTRNDFDAFLAAYSHDGDLLWVEQAGGPDQDTGRGVATDFDGFVYWTGSFAGTATWGAGAAAQTRTSAGGADGFLARYRPDGTLDALLTVGGDESDDLRAVATMPFSSRVVATGTFRSVARFGTTPLQSRGLSDLAVIGVTADLSAVEWAQQAGGSGNDYARGIAVARDETVGAAGSFENTILVGPDVLTSAGFSDALLALYRPDGTPLRGFRAGGSGFDIATGVAATPFMLIPTLGGGSSIPVIAMTGYIDGPSTFGSRAVAAQGTDAFAAVYPAPYDGTTAPADVFTVGGSGQDRGAGAGFGRYGQDLLLTGSFRAAAALGSATVTSAGGTDVFAARVPLCPAYSCLSTASEPAAAAERLGVASNPSPAPSVSLALSAPAEATVEVVDALGRVVAVLHRGTLPAGETQWRLVGLAPGTYVVRVQGGVEARRAVTVVR